VPEAVEKADPDAATDFREAVAVFPKSKKASAALSRRCLQHVLVEAGDATGPNLSVQIDSVLDKLPTHLAENVDAVRKIGNFAVHPSKSENTGEVVAVEPGEAEWLLEVLEGLFDFYYVAPARNEDRRAALKERLDDIGWGGLKGPPPTAEPPAE
jgi:hypothetical protein